MQNHQTQVLNYLKSGKTLSQTEAITYFNCYRLSAVIKCLRNIGYDIERWSHMFEQLKAYL